MFNFKYDILSTESLCDDMLELMNHRSADDCLNFEYSEYQRLSDKLRNMKYWQGHSYINIKSNYEYIHEYEHRDNVIPHHVSDIYAAYNEWQQNESFD